MRNQPRTVHIVRDFYKLHKVLNPKILSDLGSIHSESYSQNQLISITSVIIYFFSIGGLIDQSIISLSFITQIHTSADHISENCGFHKETFTAINSKHLDLDKNDKTPWSWFFVKPGLLNPKMTRVSGCYNYMHIYPNSIFFYSNKILPQKSHQSELVEELNDKTYFNFFFSVFLFSVFGKSSHSQTNTWLLTQRSQHVVTRNKVKKNAAKRPLPSEGQHRKIIRSLR